MRPDIEVKTVDDIKARRVAIDAEAQLARKLGATMKDSNTFDHDLYAVAENQVFLALTNAKM